MGASLSTIRLPGKLIALSLCNASYAAVDDAAANTSKLDSEVDMEHQGSLFPKAVFCFYCATALVTDCAWYMQKSLLAMVKEKRGRFRGLKEKKRLKNKQTKNQTVMSTHPSNQ